MDHIRKVEKVITKLNIGQNTVFEVEFDYQESTYIYLGDLEALAPPKARFKKVMHNGNDVTDMIHDIGFGEDLNIIIVANMEAIDE